MPTPVAPYAAATATVPWGQQQQPLAEATTYVKPPSLSSSTTATTDVSELNKERENVLRRYQESVAALHAFDKNFAKGQQRSVEKLREELPPSRAQRQSSRLYSGMTSRTPKGGYGVEIRSGDEDVHRPVVVCQASGNIRAVYGRDLPDDEAYEIDSRKNTITSDVFDIMTRGEPFQSLRSGRCKDGNGRMVFREFGVADRKDLSSLPFFR
jgi:hypothetical protein